VAERAAGGVMRPVLSIVVWNLHWGRARTRSSPAPAFDVVGPLAAADGDVLVLPEHFRRHDGAGVADGLAAYGYTLLEVPFVRLRLDPRPEVETPGDGWWSLVVATRLPLLDHAVLPIGKATADPAGARAVIRAGVAIGGSRFDVVGIHTSSKLWWGNPARHLRAVRAHLDELASGPAALAGDCNLWGPAVEALLPGWRRALRGRTYPARRPHSQVDHVLVNRHARAAGGAVLADHGSDHRPIRAVVTPVHGGAGAPGRSPSPDVK
jgi:endonuclease/exonuclease/phosphatase family metal-dependent hydrolase